MQIIMLNKLMFFVDVCYYNRPNSDKKTLTEFGYIKMSYEALLGDTDTSEATAQV